MIDEFFAYREPAAVGVSFRRSGKVYYFAPNGIHVRQGDQVLAQTDKGIDIGEVVFIKYDLPEADAEKELKPLMRKATPEDLAHEAELQLKEREARRVCEQKIVEHNLPMRLIAADYTFDSQRLVFFFSAEGRVDFRNLVRDLAEIFHTRIELRQVGVRDQAKMIGGLGPCGRPLCCNAFLRSFDPVGIRVAKDQGLSLNPAKISGICDRLMCCLKYEHETYLELARKLPKIGQLVQTRKGPAEVKHINLMHERLQVAYPNGDTEDLRSSEVWQLDEEIPPLPEPEEAEEVIESEPLTKPLVVRSRPPKVTQREKQPRARGEGPRGPSTRPPAAKTATPPKPAPAPAAGQPAPAEGEAVPTAPRKKRRRRDRGKRKAEGAAAAATAAGDTTAQAVPLAAQQPPRPQKPAEGGEKPDRPARRRRPRFRSRKKPEGTTPEQG